MVVMKILTLNRSSFEYYTRKVKGNSEISLDQAARKMTRNKNLSFIYRKDSPEKLNPRTWHAYGALRFMVQNDEVKWMENNCKMFPMWFNDWDEYLRLSKELEIEERYVKGFVPPVEVNEPDELTKEMLSKKKSWLQRLFKW